MPPFDSALAEDSVEQQNARSETGSLGWGSALLGNADGYGPCDRGKFHCLYKADPACMPFEARLAFCTHVEQTRRSRACFRHRQLRTPLSLDSVTRCALVMARLQRLPGGSRAEPVALRGISEPEVELVGSLARWTTTTC